MISYEAARHAPMLEWDDERMLIRNWQVRKESNALERLLLSHARIVYFWVKRVSRSHSEHDDLVSEGFLGLIKAADLFDTKQNVRFSTYARWWVKNAIFTAVRRLRSIVEVPDGLRVKTVSTSQDDTLLDQLVSKEPTPEQELIKSSSAAALRRKLANAVEALDDIDRQVVFCRGLQQPPSSVKELSEKLGLTPTKLRQIERRAMLRLRTELIARGVLSYRTV